MNPITIEATIDAPIETVWQSWITPADIMRWSHADESWHTPYAENDVRPGGRFLSRLEAKDGSFGFDFSGVYDEVRDCEYLAFTLDDGRKVTVTFLAEEKGVRVVETFDPENENPVEMQRSGWQAFLDNFKKYTETK
jgi:uncharacterized protein YndB with AHSA1/START domain